jgi:hypothetical protein
VTKWKLAGLAAATMLTVMGPTPAERARRVPLSGDLTKPLAQYTGDEFFALTRGLRYGQGADRGRRCRGTDGCTRGQQTTVRVDAISDADSLSAGNLPAYGVIAARAVNRGAGGEIENRYGMQSGGRYSYYLIVMPPGPTGATWVLEELDVAGATRGHRTVATGRFTFCNHPYVRGARADFKTCAIVKPTEASFFPSFSRQSLEDAPLWIGCASGCCTADG